MCVNKHNATEINTIKYLNIEFNHETYRVSKKNTPPQWPELNILARFFRGL